MGPYRKLSGDKVKSDMCQMDGVDWSRDLNSLWRSENAIHKLGESTLLGRARRFSFIGVPLRARSSQAERYLRHRSALAGSEAVGLPQLRPCGRRGGHIVLLLDLLVLVDRSASQGALFAAVAAKGLVEGRRFHNGLDFG